MSRCRRWCFTLFVDPFEYKHDERLVRYIIYQTEVCPESGRSHQQGYVEFIKAYRRSRVQTLLCPGVQFHLEPASGSASANREYCSKAESRLHGPFEHGTPAAPGVSGAYQQAVSLVVDGTSLRRVSSAFPSQFVRHARGFRALRRSLFPSLQRTVVVTVLVGDPGSGKTRYVYDTHGFDNVFSLELGGSQVWFDGYDGQSVLLIDDFYGGMRYNYLLRLLDIYPMDVPVKGDFVSAMWSHVYITSNAVPRDWYSEEKIVDISALCRRIHCFYNFVNGEKTEDLGFKKPPPVIVKEEKEVIDLT